MRRRISSIILGGSVLRGAVACFRDAGFSLFRFAFMISAIKLDCPDAAAVAPATGAFLSFAPARSPAENSIGGRLGAASSEAVGCKSACGSDRRALSISSFFFAFQSTSATGAGALAGAEFVSEGASTDLSPLAAADCVTPFGVGSPAGFEGAMAGDFSW